MIEISVLMNIPTISYIKLQTPNVLIFYVVLILPTGKLTLLHVESCNLILPPFQKKRYIPLFFLFQNKRYIAQIEYKLIYLYKHYYSVTQIYSFIYDQITY